MIVGSFRLNSVEFLHSIHMLSSAGLFFELVLSVICCCLIHQTQQLNNNYFIYLFPNYSWGCYTKAGDFIFKSFSQTLAIWCWLLAGSLTGDSGWGLRSLLQVPLYKMSLDFSQHNSFRVVRYLTS